MNASDAGMDPKLSRVFHPPIGAGTLVLPLILVAIESGLPSVRCNTHGAVRHADGS